MTKHSVLIAGTLTLLGACDYEAPLSDDPESSNVISGTVVLDGVDAANTMVLLFPGDNPPPPFGTGVPITIDGVSVTDYSSTDGLVSAPFSTTGLPDGTYFVTALVDADGDFHPLIDAFQGATCGDWLGAHYADLASATYATVTVAGGELADDVTVVVDREVTWERPAFEFASATTMSRSAAVEDPATLQTYQLDATSIHAAYQDQNGGTHTYDLDGPYDGGTEYCQTAFWVLINDLNGDGAPDDHPDFPAGSGLYDIWPRIYLSYLGVPNEVGGFDNPYPGETWNALGAHYPLALLGVAPLNTPTPFETLTLLWLPAAQVTYSDGTAETISDPTAVPAGAWSVTLVQRNGLTWTVPNTTAVLPSTDARFNPSGQAAVVIVE